MNIKEIISLNAEERRIFTDLGLSARLIIRESDLILEHDATFHNDINKTYSPVDVKNQCNAIFDHYQKIQELVKQLNLFMEKLQ